MMLLLAGDFQADRIAEAQADRMRWVRYDVLVSVQLAPGIEATCAGARSEWDAAV
jgi:hypothetical protein